MVERVDHLLRTKLNQPLGFASPAVRVLDPCCGTGAYLTAVLNRIHQTLLENAGDDTALVPNNLRTAALTRIFGFEIMPAPFVIAHLQVASLLKTAGAPISDSHRAGVFLTNALTGWVPEQHPQSVIFEEFRREREDSENIKQQDTILVILGNPPYNGYPGIAKIEEERDLTNAYRYPVEGVPPPEGQGLNELYVRFLRIAERRIVQNANGAGVVCFITNNSWLFGSSHTTMRHHYVQTFQNIFIDNLNGDKFRTGKKTPEGLPDPSAFSTPQNREGIQVGTAISTLVRSASKPTTTIRVRDLWGASKLAQLERESQRESTPVYSTLTPLPALGYPLAHRIYSNDYISWPCLPDLFSKSFPGIKTSRDPLVVDIDRERLDGRMKKYLSKGMLDAEIAALVPAAMKSTARFRAGEVRASLQDKGFVPEQIVRFCYRPFDLRWLYWEPTTKLLDEKREDYVANSYGQVGFVIAQSSRTGYKAPQVTRSLIDLNATDGGANCYLQSLRPGDLLAGEPSEENLTSRAMAVLNETQRAEGTLFFHALSTMHTPQYRAENAGALLGDWPRIPLPATAYLLAHSAALGRHLAELLDAESSLNLTNEWSFLGALKLPQNPNLEEALKLTAGWGSRGQGGSVMPGRGLVADRSWTDPERDRVAALAASQGLSLDTALTLLGATCVDVHLNGSSFWSTVPVNVWNYTLGGYQVLKKWLSYRELFLLGRPLHADEVAYLAQVVRRITAILLLGPVLDASYQAILPGATGLSLP
jgi:predicted helicase